MRLRADAEMMRLGWTPLLDGTETCPVAIKDGAGKTEFEKNIEAVSRVLSQASPSSRITIVGITDHSFTQALVLLSATTPDDPGYFSERLQKARSEIVHAWTLQAARLRPTFNQTDIFGVLFLASELFEERGTGDKMLIIFSDMENSTQELHLESGVHSAASVARSANLPIPNLHGVRVRIAGVDAAGKSVAYWQNLQNFWANCIPKTGAQFESDNARRELVVR